MRLLTFEDAFRVLSERISPLKGRVSIPIESSLNQVLVGDILADDDYPRFDNSSVDGFALGGSEPCEPGQEFTVRETIAAGNEPTRPLMSGDAVRVYTGAPVPLGTWGVVMQEDVRGDLNAPRIQIAEHVATGQNIRPKGSEVVQGEVLLKSGTQLNSGGVALLALAGQASVFVRPDPRVGVVATGDEVIEHRDTPKGAQIRDTSQPMLQAILSRFGAQNVQSARVQDDPIALKRQLLELASQTDLIVVTGGVSVGARDFLPETLQEVGEVHFHGVSMRPGKPLLFGSIGSTFVFGLPGNPASSYVACQLFVRESVRLLRGATASPLLWVQAQLGEDHLPCGREDFVRVALEWREGRLWAEPRYEQASYGLRSLAGCHGIARLSAEVVIGKGELCHVLLTV